MLLDYKTNRNGYLQFIKVVFFAFILTLFCMLPGICANVTVTAKKAASPPVIDGVLESAWDQSEQHTTFLNMHTGLPAKEKTIARVLFDEKGLYISVECLTADMKSLKAVVSSPDSNTRFPQKSDTKMLQDDIVEIMLDPGVTKSAFYNFAVNANGAMYNSRRTHSGVVVEKWNGDWKAASKITADRWTTEIFIPFYTIALDSNVKNGWSINICRTTTNPVEYTSIGETGALNRPYYFRSLQGINIDLSEYMWNVAAKSQSVVRGNKKTSLNYAIIKNNSDVKREISTELFNSDGKTKSLSFELLPGETKEVLLNELPFSKNKKEIDYDVIVKNANSQKELTFQHLSIIPETRLIKLKMTQPAYRDILFSSQKINDIRIKVEALLPAKETSNWKVKGILKRNNKNIASSSFYPLKQGAAEISIPAKNLPIGEYEIIVSAFSANKSVLDTEKVTLKKLPPLKGEAWIDTNGNLYVDGKPFLATGYMCVLTENLEQIAKNGGNVIHNYAPFNWTAEYMAKHLAEAKRLNLKIAWPPWGNNEDAFRTLSYLTAEEKERITIQVNKYKNNPNFLAWYMADEPEGVGQPVSRMQEAYQLVRSLDPYHPCIMLNDSLNGIQTYSKTADIMMPDPYCSPTIDGFPQPMTKISDFMDQVKKSAPESASWICLQAFDYGDFRDYLTKDRAPNMEEFRSMSWLAINHGCKGFIHYGWPYIVTYPDLYLGIPYIFKELKALPNIVLSPNKKQIKIDDSYKGIDAAFVKQDGAYWVIVVNTLQKPGAFSLVLPELGSADLKVVGENLTVKSVNGKLSDNLGASVTRIYTTSKQNFDLNKAEAQKAIDAVEMSRRKPGNLAFWIDNGTTFKASSWVTENQYGTPRSIANGFISKDGTEGWKDRNAGFPDWMELAWPEAKEIGRIVLYAHNLTDYKLQYSKDGNWVDLKSIEGDSALQQKTEVVFSPVNTKAIRVFINSAFGERSIVSEIECYSK